MQVFGYRVSFPAMRVTPQTSRSLWARIPDERKIQPGLNRIVGYRISIIRNDDTAGRSMLPAIRPGDWLLVSSRGASHLKRGDVIVHVAIQDGNDKWVKRVVGLPGEEVRLREGGIYINGELLHEPYLGGLPPSLGLDDRAWNVGDRAYFVMGDNRAHSTDSRDYGSVSLASVLGRVVGRIWPPTGWGRSGLG